MDSELYSLVNSGSGTPATSSVQDEATRPIDWTEEARTDLPQRSPERIQHLLKYESSEQTQARIRNDVARHVHARTGAMGSNPQTRLISPTEVVPFVQRWGN